MHKRSHYAVQLAYSYNKWILVSNSPWRFLQCRWSRYWHLSHLWLINLFLLRLFQIFLSLRNLPDFKWYMPCLNSGTSCIVLEYFSYYKGIICKNKEKVFFPSILENPVDLLFEKFLLNISLKSSWKVATVSEMYFLLFLWKSA